METTTGTVRAENPARKRLFALVAVLLSWSLFSRNFDRNAIPKTL